MFQETTQITLATATSLGYQNTCSVRVPAADSESDHFVSHNHQLVLIICSPDDQPSDKLKVIHDLVSEFAKMLHITLKGNKKKRGGTTHKFWAAAIPVLKEKDFAYL